MPASGRPWNRERTRYKAECKARGAACWLCLGTKGPIDYDSAYDPSKRQPLLFTVDHSQPTSLGADPMRVDLWRPAHWTCNSSRGNTTRGQYPTSRQW
jgi:hypothetical protein